MSTTATTAPTFEEAVCVNCGRVARLTSAGWRHGWPPHGHDGHCIGTGHYPVVGPTPAPGGSFDRTGRTEPVGVTSTGILVATEYVDGTWSYGGFRWASLDDARTSARISGY